METFASAYYWIRLAALGIGSLLALIAFALTMRRRGFTGWRQALWASFALALPVALVLATHVSPNVMWAAVLAVVGLAVGFASGMLSKIEAREGRMTLRRFFLAPMTTLLATILALTTMLFGATELFMLALLGLVLAAGLTVGQATAETTAALRRRGKENAAPAQPVPEA